MRIILFSLTLKCSIPQKTFLVSVHYLPDVVLTYELLVVSPLFGVRYI